jgi:hypothetical protein
MQAHASKQEGGKGERHAGSTERERIGEILRLELVDIGYTGRSLDPDLFPGVGAKFRLSTSGSYQVLRATAGAYLEAIGPVKAAFVEREYAADFDEKLAELIADFDEATENTDAGLQEQSGGTAGLREVSTKAMKVVRELDAMITKKLRTSDPALLKVWKQTQHVERTPMGATPAPPAPSLVVTAAAATSKEPEMLVEPRLNGSKAAVLA